MRGDTGLYCLVKFPFVNPGVFRKTGILLEHCLKSCSFLCRHRAATFCQFHKMYCLPMHTT